jgi:uncharacterized metal-binding protein YceD (DUF177 family)
MKRKESYVKQFEIVFSSLNLGKHSFSFILKGEFFEYFEILGVDSGDLIVDLEFDKMENLITLYFHISGQIESPCGRCMETIFFPLEIQERLYVKFSDEKIDNEELLILSPNEYKLNISDLIYELIHVNIPISIAHEDESKCNPEILKYLKSNMDVDNTTSQEKEIDPRWNALLNTKKD